VKIFELAKTVQLFERAAHDEGLRMAVPPIIAASFGVYPLALVDRRITVACPAWVEKDLLSFLEQGLDLEVEPIYFDREIILGYITKVYLRDRMVDVNTFGRIDFLSPDNLSSLFAEKEDSPGPYDMGLPSHLLLTLDLSFRSTLENLDRKEGYPFFATETMDVPFERNGQGLSVFGGPVAEDTFCLVKRSNLYAGVENRHGYAEHRVNALPFHIHPSEVQLLKVETDGRVELLLFDRQEETGPGDRPLWQCEYYFLYFGSRYRRRIEVQIHDVAVWNRDELHYRDRQPKWSVDDLGRWLGLDW